MDSESQSNMDTVTTESESNMTQSNTVTLGSQSNSHSTTESESNMNTISSESYSNMVTVTTESQSNIVSMAFEIQSNMDSITSEIPLLPMVTSESRYNLNPMTVNSTSTMTSYEIQSNKAMTSESDTNMNSETNTMTSESESSINLITLESKSTMNSESTSNLTTIPSESQLNIDTDFERLLLESDDETDLTEIGSMLNNKDFIIPGDDTHIDEPDKNEDQLLLRRNNDDDSDDDEIDTVNDDIEEKINIKNMEWTDEIKRHERFKFEDKLEGLNPDISDNCKTPFDFYRLFLNDEIINLIVEETNRYALSKNPKWTLTNNDEILKFFALLLQMGIVKLPTLRSYWSRDPVYGNHNIGSNVMPRNRFEMLLKYLHLTDNNNINKNDKLYKISKFVELFNKACQYVYRPSRDVCIDESLVPFKGRVAFRQYIKIKRHKYGIKLFKICGKGGYTYKTIIYAGKQDYSHNNTNSNSSNISENIVMNLMDSLLDQGRHLYTDNWYTSLTLAEKLIKRKTHLIGTLRKNRKGLPVKVLYMKIPNKTLIAQQNKSGITVMKYHDKRDVLMLSTLHDDQRKNNQTNKPVLIDDYNYGKTFIDLSDQMASYTPFVRKTTKWYIRVFLHLITQTGLVNSWKLYNDFTGNKIGLTNYKIFIVKSILDCKKPETPSKSHFLHEVPGPKRNSVRRCVGCYKKLAKQIGSVMACRRTRKVHTRCSRCNKAYCIECFQTMHKICNK